MYVWSITDRLAANAIRALVPFLKIKLREAQYGSLSANASLTVGPEFL